jgi:hypothetical protein
LWKEFGPINLEVAVPEGISFRASVPCSNGGVEERLTRPPKSQKARFNIYRAVLKQKTGELYLAVDADTWKQADKQTADKNSNDKKQLVAQKIKGK